MALWVNGNLSALDVEAPAGWLKMRAPLEVGLGRTRITAKNQLENFKTFKV